MRKNSVLVLMISAMATALIASRCSDDDEKPVMDESATSEMPPDAGDPTDAADATDAKAEAMDPMDPAAPTDSAEPVDAGIEADPLGGTMGGDDMAAPLEDPGEAPADGTNLDDPTFEPEPVPEEAADL